MEQQELGEFSAGFLSGCVSFLYRLFSERRLRKKQKEVLRKCLLSDRWEWRHFKSLCRAIRENELTTKTLLIEMGARANTKDRDMWTLDK